MSLDTNKLDILITIQELVAQPNFYLYNSKMFSKFKHKNEIINVLECLPEIMIEHLENYLPDGSVPSFWLLLWRRNGWKDLTVCK